MCSFRGWVKQQKLKAKNKTFAVRKKNHTKTLRKFELSGKSLIFNSTVS